MQKFLLLIPVLLLNACASADMQGRDPREYYKNHPKVNKLETRSIVRAVHFEPGASTLEPGERNALFSTLREASPEATDSIVVQTSPSQLGNKLRRASLNKNFRSFGYKESPVTFEPAQVVATDEAIVTLHYVSVVPPDCPDWKLSPYTSYSNTHQGNFGCATVVNLGQQVSDPHDLVRGTGEVGMDPVRNSQVLTDYREGKIKASTAGAATSGTDSSSAEASPSTGGN